ncbi:Thiosulfate reductase electron transfer subunit PhsB [Neomoorella glycerini]|uniref:Thiosulfate reductase electron transfer subunit PhsB n=1 Tax=Neomoorella glycerini TaxID=55779 RepID=A0A6I5ZNS0_9FIRM|nr:4Fe-4S dicluster domain-containing protein [Moorella glycerini]QGP91562.1 Thiosulfate reductase electron transfer subunit PhsB [Moorella glycerini]
MMDYVLLVDSALCINCQACTIACRQAGNTNYSLPRLKVDGSRHYSCHHCEQPACCAVCSGGALIKNKDGIVLWERDNCLGCKLCVAACPHEAINYNSLFNEPVKCTFCWERLQQGEEPACSSACTTGARRFGKKEDILAHLSNRQKELASRGIKAVVEGLGDGQDDKVLFLKALG